MNGTNLKKSVFISCFFAGCLEMYDFVIFGFLAPVIHKNYLSFLDEATGVIIAYVLFAIGFICRPIGAIIFGYIGDKYGRKKALVLSVSFMGAASLCLAILPKYDDIGILACYLIVLIRIIQGISVGGEYSGAAIYAIEHSNKANIGFIGSTVLAGTTLGVLLATFVSSLLENPILPSYSWRFAFLIGAGLTIVGYFIRRNLAESPLFTEEITKSKVPLFHGLKLFRKQFFASILLSGANNANYYFALVFIPSYLKKESSSSLDFSNWWLAGFMLLLEPACGLLSDKIGRKKILVGVFLMLSIYNFIFLETLISYSTSIIALLLIVVSAVLISLSVSSVNIIVLEVFPVSCRYSCGALSYSIGAAVFGGTTPLVCSLLIDYMGNEPLYLGSYISFVSVLGMIGAIIILRNKVVEKKFD